MSNEIHNIDTKWVDNEAGEFPAVVMGLNIPDRENFRGFVSDVVEKFKCQRMCSPPETANMTITIMGDVTCKEFADLWRGHSRSDQILQVFMSQMRVADVLRFTPEGGVIDSASLTELP